MNYRITNLPHLIVDKIFIYLRACRYKIDCRSGNLNQLMQTQTAVGGYNGNPELKLRK